MHPIPGVIGRKEYVGVYCVLEDRVEVHESIAVGRAVGLNPAIEGVSVRVLRGVPVDVRGHRAEKDVHTTAVCRCCRALYVSLNGGERYAPRDVVRPDEDYDLLLSRQAEAVGRARVRKVEGSLTFLRPR